MQVNLNLNEEDVWTFKHSAKSLGISIDEMATKLIEGHVKLITHSLMAIQIEKESKNLLHPENLISLSDIESNLNIILDFYRKEIEEGEKTLKIVKIAKDRYKENK